MKNLILMFLLGLLVVNYCGAETLPISNTEYSAIKQMETSDGSFTQSVFHSFGKERTEMQMEGMQMVMINRPDKKLAWQLMPMMQMYMEIELNTANNMTGKAPDDVSIDKVGSEVVDGMDTDKYKLIMKDKSAGGFIWLSADNIPVKMDFISKEGNKKQRISMQLTNLKVAPQDPALFELPEGYHAMPGRGSMLKSLMGVAR
jgi:hypothetical protein